MQEARPSLHWVEGINFELTYDCHLACAHCLQADLRARGWTGWAALEPLRRAIHDAVALGFVGTAASTSRVERSCGRAVRCRHCWRPRRLWAFPCA